VDLFSAWLVDNDVRQERHACGNAQRSGARRAAVRAGAMFDAAIKALEHRREIGFDLVQDSLLYHVTESGIAVVEGHRSTVDIATMLV